MRLGKRLRHALKEAIKESFGDVDAYLFGSRVDDTKRGGDIDIALDVKLSRAAFRQKKAKFITSLIRRDIELKIDLVSLHSNDVLLAKQIKSEAIPL